MLEIGWYFERYVLQIQKGTGIGRRTLKYNSFILWMIYKEGILPDTIQRLRSGKPITTQTINTLCSVLDCTIGDIMEYIPDDGN